MLNHVCLEYQFFKKFKQKIPCVFLLNIYYFCVRKEMLSVKTVN